MPERTVRRPGRLFRLAALAAVVLAVSCAPRKRAPEAPPPEPPEARSLYEQAERRFQDGALAEAAVLFERYLERSPGGPSAPAALLRLGKIHGLRGEFSSARRTYERLIAEHPASPLRAEAFLERLALPLAEGRPAEVEGLFPEALAAAETPSQRVRAWTLRAEARSRLGERIAAVEFLLRALQEAPPAEREAAAARLRLAILRLTPQEARGLAARPEGELRMDYLLFQAGMVFAREGRAEEARALLEAFRARYPEHEERPRAERELAALESLRPAKPFRIGALLPLSGSHQALGQRALRGLELALHLHHAAGGGPPVELVVRDTASEPGRTAQALQELAGQEVSAVVGPLVHVEAAMPEAERRGIPLLVLTQKEGVTRAGGAVFRNFPTPGAQVEALVSLAFERLGVREAVALYPDEPYGRTFADLFRRAFEQHGGSLLAAVPYDPRATDFAGAIRKLLPYTEEVPKEGAEERREPARPAARRGRGEAPADSVRVCRFQAVFLPDEPRKVAMIAPQLAYHDIRDVFLLGTNLWNSEALLRLAGPYVQGAVFVDAFFAGSRDPAVRRFVEAYEAAYGEAPGLIEALAFDSAVILAELFGRGGARAPAEVASALRAAEGFSGVTGRTRFRETGEPEKTLRRIEIRGRRFVELE